MRIPLGSLMVALTVVSTGCIPVLESPEGNTTGIGDPFVLETWDCRVPANGWPASAPPEGLQAQGFEVGEVAPDFYLLDQNGDPVCLWQFYGRPIALDVSTMWCAPCQELAEGTAETSEAYEEDGFVYLTLLAEEVDGANPRIEDLQGWADAFDIVSPVIGDVDKQFTADVVSNNQYPALLVIDRELRVASRINPPSDEGLRSALDDVLESE